MDLPNTYFQDFPIEFKEINPKDFPSFVVENNREKIIIEPNDKGYINEAIQNNIQLDKKNTVVINAAVGQGKSYAIIQSIRRYYEAKEEYLIVVASPFVSLVDQYVKDIHRDGCIPKNQIYNYENIGRDPRVPYIGKKVQVVTVNTLLGNPGEDGFKNSDKKRAYLNDLISHSKVNGIKVVFIYDEIHDAIHNFKEEYIFNLWKWRDVIVKNYIISATFNEASKVVIGYLAELTESKIKIIESKRIKFPEKQSDLYLHYNTSWQYAYNDPDIEVIVESLLNKGKDIDILCYSKTLVKNIINQKDSKIRKRLAQKYGKENIQNCTSDLILNQRPENEPQKNRYDNTKCNIGTNFKTGVSIKKDNHAFVVIMPPRSSKSLFKNKYGIFSNGVISIIQALARQRYIDGVSNNGEIHIILPKPRKFDFKSLKYARMDKEQIKIFSKAYKEITFSKTAKIDSRYYPLRVQDLMIKSFYDGKLVDNLREDIKHIKGKERKGLTRLEFPSYELFKLEHGEDFLANQFSFFGDDLPCYVTYCAFTNQFINCSLKGITTKSIMVLRENNIQEDLHNFYNTKLGEDYFYSSVQNYNDRLCYNAFKEELFGNFDVRLLKGKKKNNNTDDLVSVKRDENKLVEKQILRFVNILKYGKSSYFQDDFDNRLNDEEYPRGNYILSCISYSKDIDLKQSNLLEKDEKRVEAYQTLNYFRDKLISIVRHYCRGSKEYYYLPVKPLDDFIYSIEDISRFEDMVSNIISCDTMFRNEIFEYKSIVSKNDTINKKLNAFYTKLLEDFFQLDPNPKKIKVEGSANHRDNVKEVLSIKLLPSFGALDLISQPNYTSQSFIYERATPLDESMLKILREYLEK
jgi:hypothetical protein